jgi:hypothetical protein
VSAAEAREYETAVQHVFDADAAAAAAAAAAQNAKVRVTLVTIVCCMNVVSFVLC